MKRLAAAALSVAAVVSSAVLLAGAPPTSAGGGPDPCDLLRRKELRAAFGQRAGRPRRPLGPMFCQWRLEPTDDRAPGQVNTTVVTGADAREQFRLGESLSTGTEAVDGLGRRAFLSPETGTLWVLVDRRTMFYVQANVYDADAQRIDDVRDALVGLAKRARARV